MRSVFARIALASAALVACSTPDPEGAKKDAAVQTPPVDTKTTPPVADVKAPDPAATAGAPATGDMKTADTAGAATAGAATAGAATAGEATAGATAGAATAGDAAAPDPAAAAADKTKLLGEAKAKKTSDTRAKKALEDAEKAGATPRELAEAANARGEELFGEPDRAKAFFEWARDKDTSYPEPVYNLAKQTVMAGEIPATVDHLKEVNKRGGKKLLKQVGFDPAFEIVKDDPEIAKLIK